MNAKAIELLKQAHELGTGAVLNGAGPHAITQFFRSWQLFLEGIINDFEAENGSYVSATYAAELEAKLDEIRKLCGTRLSGSAAEVVLEILDR